MAYVYGDIFIAVQLVVDYIILYSTAILTRERTSFSRLAAGAVLGSVYAFGYLYPDFRFLYSGPLVLLFPGLMLVMAFAPVSPRKFLRLLGYFYVSSLFLAGIAFALVYLSRNTGTLTPRLLVAPKIAAWVPTVAGILLVAAAFQVARHLRRRLRRDLLRLPVKVDVGGEVARLEALVDTGNQLRDPLSGVPVVVVEATALKALLPKPLVDGLHDSADGWWGKIADSICSPEWKRRLRVVPYMSLGKMKGMLIGFRPDRLVTVYENHDVPLGPAVVGLYNGRLTRDGGYQALLPAELLEREENVSVRIS